MTEIEELRERLRVAESVRDDARRVSQQYLDEKRAAEQAYRELKDTAATIIAVKDEAHERMHRVIVAVKRWRDSDHSYERSPTEEGLLVLDTYDTYVEWLYPGITKP